jgi:hypothetical protein
MPLLQGSTNRAGQCKRKIDGMPIKVVETLTLSNLIFLPTTYSPALICFGQEKGWWITCNYPTVLKEKNIEKQKE